MLSCFLIVLFIEAAYQLLKDRAHGMIIERRKPDASAGFIDRNGAEIYGRVEELFNQISQDIGFYQGWVFGF
jgi:hypothetical protein